MTILWQAGECTPCQEFDNCKKGNHAQPSIKLETYLVNDVAAMDSLVILPDTTVTDEESRPTLPACFQYEVARLEGETRGALRLIELFFFFFSFKCLCNFVG